MHPSNTVVSWPLLLGFFLVAVPIHVARSADEGVPSAISQSLTFHASFDHGLDADLARGDKRLYTIFKQNPFEAQPGLHTEDMTRIAPGKGLIGDALRFTKREARWLFYKAAGNIPHSTNNWSGTVSCWLRLDPETDLAPGYCDPIQLTPRTWNDASFFVDFDKDGDPRDFRLGAFPDLTAWNPEGKSMNDLPDELRPLLKVRYPPFSREEWTHVAFTWTNFNTGRKDGVAILYLNGTRQGELTGWPQTHTWSDQESRLLIGLNYIGLFDDLACFNRALSADEIVRLYTLRGRMK